MATFRPLTIGRGAAESLAVLYRSETRLRVYPGRAATHAHRGFCPGAASRYPQARFHGFDCCQMTLLVSVKGDNCVTGVVPARNQLRRILP